MANVALLHSPVRHTRTHSWFTSILTTITGVKQRTGLFSWPRVSIKNTYRLDEQAYSYFMRNVYKNYGSIWEVPLIADITEIDVAVTAGDEELVLEDISDRFFYAGGKLAIVTPGDISTYEILEIISISDSANTIHLSSGEPASNWAKGSLVYPIIECELVNEMTLSPLFQPKRKYYDHSFFFEEAFRSQRVNVYSTYSGADTYLDIDLFVISPSSIQHAISKTIDKQLGRTKFTDVIDEGYSMLNMSASFSRISRAEVFELLNFFDAHEGGLKRFWMPSFTRDLVITQAINSADDTIYIQNIEYTGFWLSNDAVGRHVILFIAGTDSYICRKIIAAPSSTQVQFNSAVGINIPASMIDSVIISFLHLSHFSRDYINMDYSFLDSDYADSNKIAATSSIETSSVVGEDIGGWANSIQLTLDDTNIDSDLSDFPILIHLSASSGIGGVDVSQVFDHLLSNANRKKIAVKTSGGTELYVEIERWDHANEQAWLHVKAPSVLAAGSILNFYYDIDQDDNTDYVGDTGDTVAQNVWDDDFVFVSHMAQDPDNNLEVLRAAEFSALGNPAIAGLVIPAVDCTGLTKANGILKIDLKVNTPAIMDVSYIEITSSGGPDVEEWNTIMSASQKAQMNTAYQTFFFPLTNAITSGGELVVNQIDYIRWVCHTTGGNIHIYWKNAEIVWEKELVKDSTSNANHATPVGPMTTADLVDAKAGKGLDFDGTDDHLHLGIAASLCPISALTYEGIFKTSFVTNEQTLFAKISQDLGASHYHSLIQLNADQELIFYVWDSGGVAGAGAQTDNGVGGNFCDGAYHHFAGTFDLADSVPHPIIYVDGTLNVIGTDTISSINNIPDDISAIGNRISSTGAWKMVGILDEMRISKIARNAAWIKATKHSNFDNLITFVP